MCIKTNRRNERKGEKNLICLSRLQDPIQILLKVLSPFRYICNNPINGGRSAFSHPPNWDSPSIIQPNLSTKHQIFGFWRFSAEFSGHCVVTSTCRNKIWLTWPSNSCRRMHWSRSNQHWQVDDATTPCWMVQAFPPFWPPVIKLFKLFSLHETLGLIFVESSSRRAKRFLFSSFQNTFKRSVSVVDIWIS